MQASIVMATFLYQAANRDQLLPRKPLPQAPPEPPAKPKPEPAETPAPEPAPPANG